MKERYDTGIWHLYLEDRYLHFAGMLGESHETEEAALNAIRNQVSSDVSDNVIEQSKKHGHAVLYFISHLTPQDDYTTLIEMNTYVSEAYGDDVIETLRDYDSYQKINLHVI